MQEREGELPCAKGPRERGPEGCSVGSRAAKMEHRNYCLAEVPALNEEELGPAVCPQEEDCL